MGYRMPFTNNTKIPTQRSITAVANQKGIDFYELRTVHQIAVAATENRIRNGPG